MESPESLLMRGCGKGHEPKVQKVSAEVKTNLLPFNHVYSKLFTIKNDKNDRVLGLP